MGPKARPCSGRSLRGHAGIRIARKKSVVDPDPSPGPLSGIVRPADAAANDTPNDRTSLPAGADAVVQPVAAEALAGADPAEARAAAVSSDLHPGAIVFESIPSGGAADQSALIEHQALREQYEAERERADSLARLDRHRTTFFSDVSEECRTPLTLILGPAADLLAGAHGSLP